MPADPAPLFGLDDLRPVALWAADCAERALPLFEVHAPGDPRPRAAIAAARAFGAGGPRVAALRTRAWAALAAAKDADPPASAAARAAAAAAGVAYTHPIATPHQVNHLLSPAAYAALAIAGDDEVRLTEALRLAVETAPPQARDLLRRLPGRAPARKGWSALLFRLDAALRA